VTVTAKPAGGINYTAAQIDQLKQEFIAAAWANGKGGDYDSSESWSCPDLTSWFIHEKCTGLTSEGGDGGDVAANLVNGAANKGKLTFEPSDKLPRVPCIFSSRSGKYYASSVDPKTGEVYGHTGVIVAVNGNVLTLLETYSGCPGKVRSDRTVTWAPNDSVQFVYVGGYLK